MKRSRRTFLGVALAAVAAGGTYLLVRAESAGGTAAEGTKALSDARADAPAAVVGAAETTLSPGPAPDARAPADETVLEGVVLDAETGDPVPGARVRWGDLESETDVGGTYRVRAVGELPDVEEIVAGADGYLHGSTSCDPQVWSPAGRLEPILLARVRERRPGRVRDGLDRPVDGAVILVGPGTERYVSKADGSFGPVPIGDRGLEWRAFSPREARAEGTWDRDAPAPELEVVLPVAAFVDGDVVDEEGRPLVGADVFLLGHPDEARIVTGPGGRFRWPLAATEEAVLAATTGDRTGFHGAYAGAPVRIVAEEGARLPEPSSAPPPPCSDPRYGRDAERTRIGAEVIDERGHALPGAEVVVSARNGPPLTFERTDAAGRFVLEGFHDPVTVRISHPLAAHAWTLTLEDGARVLPSRIQLPRRVSERSQPEAPVPLLPAVVEGRVFDAEGRPVPGVEVEAAQSRDLCHTDARGAFVLEGLPTDGPASLSFVARGFPPLQVGVPSGSSPVRVDLPPRGGIVVTGRGGRLPSPDDPPPALELSLPEEPFDPVLSVRGPRGDGRVLVLEDRVRIDVPVGRYLLRFRRPPGAWVRFPDVDVRAGRDVVLAYDARVFGRLRLSVLDPLGAPVGGATVTLTEDGANLGSTGSEGVLALGPDDDPEVDLPEGPRRLAVISDDHVPGFTEPVDLRHDAALTVRLAHGEALLGDLAGSDGPLSGGGTLAWRAPHGPPIPLGSIANDGTWGPLLPLPPGRQTLLLVRAGVPAVELPVDVVPGGGGRPLHLRLP